MLTSLGLLLLVVVGVDALWTTITLRGAGPVTAAVCRLVWGCLRRCPRRWHARVLPLGGSACLLASVLAWVALLWLGWFLVFSSDPGSVVDAFSRRAAGPWQRAYFVGFTITTLGVGDFVAEGRAWQIAADLAALSGLFLVTLSITYMLPVLSAATEKHQLGALLGDLGRDPVDLVVRWRDLGYDRLAELGLQTVGPQLHLHAQRHLAYPVLHYFRSARRESALAPHLALYDQALALLACAVPARQRPADEELAMLRAPVSELLELSRTYVQSADASLPAPRLHVLREHGLALEPDDAFARAWSRGDERRRRLAAFVESAGWDPADAW